MCDPADDVDPTVIMVFLPADDIDLVSTTLKELIERERALPEYDICVINSKQPGDPKQRIAAARVTAKGRHKRALMVLSGRQCSLGVTLDGCDAVVLLNGGCGGDAVAPDDAASDMIYQMMFRSMTEGPGKRFGFVIDVDVQRALRAVAANQPQSDEVARMTQRETMTYLLTEHVISLNPDHWDQRFGKNRETRDAYISRVYEAFTARSERNILDLIQGISMKSDMLARNDCALLKAFVTMRRKALRVAKALTARAAAVTPSVPAGIAKEAVENDADPPADAAPADDDAETNADPDDDDDEDDEDELITPEDMARHLVPIMALITVRDKTTSVQHMLDLIEANPKMIEVLMDRTRAWWGDAGSLAIVRIVVKIYEVHMACDVSQVSAVDKIKDLFVQNINNAAELSRLIDTTLIPLASEKKANAEVSTPAPLRKDMLNRIPPEFWTVLRRVLEPCAGKGGFLVDMMGRFMEGLAPTIPNETERRRIIVEECLYWADINPFNVLVCNLLLNPLGTHNTKGYLGDSLALDPAAQWGIAAFDAVVGNPPYSTDPSLKDTRPLYNIFTEKYIDMAQYLLFVIPSRWFVGGKGLDPFRAFMTTRTDIALIVHEDDATKWFGKCVDIKGGAQYFLKDSGYTGPCMFDGAAYDLSKYDVVIMPRFHAIVDVCAALPSITELYKGRTFGVESNDKRLVATGNVTCFVSRMKAASRRMALAAFTFTPDNTYWKVVTPKASHAAFSGFGEIFVGTPAEIHTGSYISFRADTREEAESLVSYMQTRFANHMLSIRKISHNLCKDTCKWIPMVPLDRIWTDDAVCAHLNIDRSMYP
jgi:hypothetical protein